ncbi:MAG: hypothetical protein P9M03_09910 [Candidatus Theseobacter exili]|nr:hypothetical protein [Candidatus Theseobacter exili]
MLLFIKRLIVLIVIPVGLVLLLAPLYTSRNIYKDADFVFLVAGPVTPEDNNREALVQVTRKQLEPYEQVLFTVLERKKEVDFYRPSQPAADVLGLESLGNTLSQMDGVSPEQGEQYKKDLVRQQKSIRNTENQAQQYRQMGFTSKQGLWDMEPTNIPIEEWDQLKEALSLQGDEKTSFVFEDTLYTCVVRYESGYVNTPVPGLEQGRKITGVVFLVIGLFLITGLYRKKHGIMIAKTWCVMLWDVIVVLVSGFFVYGAIDLLFMKLFGTGMRTEEFIQFMGVFWVLLAIPAVTLFIAASAAQAVTVTEQGMSLDGLFSKRFVSWDELKSIEVTELHSVKRAGGIIAPKQLMKIMRLEGESSSITLMEPPLKSTKKRILEAMLTHAPEEWKNTIEEEGKTWTAYL